MITGTRPKKPVVAQPGTERNDDVEGIAYQAERVGIKVQMILNCS